MLTIRQPTTNDLSYVGTTTATNYRVTDLNSSTDYFYSEIKR
jgi:hypothetical protein